MTIPRFLRPLLMALALCAATPIWAAQPELNSGLPQVRLHMGRHAITAEVARTAEQQQTGLMNRRSLPPDHGMVFDFARAQPVCMWMKNTFIPLSVAFITADGRIVNIADMQPQTEDIHCAQTDVRYALEAPLHWFARRGIRPGSTVLGLPGPR